MSFNSVRIDLLGKDNFDTWKIQVLVLLVKTNTRKYVSGSLPKPLAPAKSDLILSISPAELRQF